VAYFKRLESREASMKTAKIVLATAAALTAFGSVALAQQTITGTGTVTRIDRISGTIAIQTSTQPTQSGTVGANTSGSVGDFKVQGANLETVHAGDKVTFSGTEAGGTKTITKIDKER
jgi:Cu/Ag efflux protein CusF